jgi:alpha-galactosidase
MVRAARAALTLVLLGTGAVQPAASTPGSDPLAPTGRWTAPTRGNAPTPPMGWNSWNAFRTEVDEDKVVGAAEALVSTGLARLGYRYVNIDDGWWLRRRADGRLQIRTSIFPSARTGGSEETSFRPFVDRLHAMGLKAGIYTDLGRNACSQAYDLKSPNLPVGTTAEREVGLHGHVDQDIRLFFAEWGFDYVKVDACGIADYAADRTHVRQLGYRPFAPLMVRGELGRSQPEQVRRLYEQVSDALARHNPDNDYVLSICAWGQADVRKWGQWVGNGWRTSDDITPNWTRMLHSFDSAATRALYARPGAWNDPDMLFIGTGDFDADHLVEARSHFALWAMLNAPLLIGYDLRQAPRALIDIWGNADIVALNQDPAGNQAVLAYDSDDLQILVKTLADGRKGVAVFNRGLGPVEAQLTAEHLKFDPAAPVELRDLWSKEALPAFVNEMRLPLAPRETRVFLAKGTRMLADGLYLSEMPAQIHVAQDGVRLAEPDPTTHRMIVPWSGSRGGGSWPGYGGWGGAQADAGPYGGLLIVAGRRYASGIGILADSRMEVRNARGHRRFTAEVGVADATRNRRTKVRFEVYGDGRLLAQSRMIGFGDAVQPLAADLAGVRVIELVVRTSGQTEVPATAIWGAAALSGTAAR